MILTRRNDNANWMSNWFDDFFYGEWLPKVKSTTPAINVKETEKSYEMEIASPGMKKEFCKVNLNEDGNLVIHLENTLEKKEENKKEHYLRQEFSYSNFSQSYLLPKDVDKDAISAQVEDGILRINMPKIEKDVAKIERIINIA